MPDVFIENEQDDFFIVTEAAAHLDPARLHDLLGHAQRLLAEQEAGA